MNRASAMRRKISTWLYTIASNLVRDRYRWRTRHPQVPLDDYDGETGTEFVDRLTSGDSSPTDHLESTERAEAVCRTVAVLPVELRQPWILAEWEGKRQAEIAVILGRSPKAVETRIYRARKHLRQPLRPLLQEV